MRWWDQRLSGPLYCRMDASFQILTQSATRRDLCNMVMLAEPQRAHRLSSWACSSPGCRFVAAPSGLPQGHPFYAAHFRLL